MSPLRPGQQALFGTIVEALQTADRSPAPDLALALHFGAEEISSRDPRIIGLSEGVRSAVRMLHKQNPEGLREAAEAAGEAVAFRIRAILGQDTEGA